MSDIIIYGMKGKRLADFARMVESKSMPEAITDEFDMDFKTVGNASTDVLNQVSKFGGFDSFINHIDPPDKVINVVGDNLPDRERTSSGLRDTLFDAMDALKAGELTSTDAIAICKISSEICKTVSLEMQAENHMRANNRETGQTKVLKLGK